MLSTRYWVLDVEQPSQTQPEERQNNFLIKTPSKDVPKLQLKVGSNIIIGVALVRNLEMFFDQHITMECQVAATVTKSCTYHLSNIGRIRRFISTDACKTLVNSIVTARLDCETVYFSK